MENAGKKRKTFGVPPAFYMFFLLPLHPLIIFKKLLYNAFISLFTQKNEGVT